VTGSYTLLKTEILAARWGAGGGDSAVPGGSGVDSQAGQLGFRVGFDRRGKASLNVSGVFRGSILDVEPTYGAAAASIATPAMRMWGSA